MHYQYQAVSTNDILIQSIIDHHYINRLCDCSCHQKENLNRHLFIKERSHLNVTFVTKLLSQFMMEISPWYVWLVRKYLQQRNLEFARKDKTYYSDSCRKEAIFIWSLWRWIFKKNLCPIHIKVVYVVQNLWLQLL